MMKILMIISIEPMHHKTLDQPYNHSTVIKREYEYRLDLSARKVRKICFFDKFIAKSRPTKDRLF